MRILLVGLFSLLVSHYSYSIMLSPTVLEYNIDSAKSSKIVVTNNSSERLALEANIYKLNFHDNGEFDSKQLNNDAFLVFPPAAFLSPGEKQVFRLQWVKGQTLPQSESFFVRFSQINLNSPKNESDTVKSNVQFQIHYNALVHIYSDTQKPQITMYVKDSGLITLENEGSKYSYSNLLQFNEANLTSSLKINEVIGDLFIPPYSTLTIKPSIKLPAGEYHGRTQ